MNLRLFLILGLSLLVCVPIAWAADPVVSNVTLQQLGGGSGTLVIDYQVEDADGDSLTVAVQLSADGGETWDFPVVNPVGDIGGGILPGGPYSIIIELGQLPEEVLFEQMAAKVIASDTGVYHAANSPGCHAILHLPAPDWSEPDMIEKYSRADVVILMGADLWKGSPNDTIPVIDRLKAMNPDIVVVGYVSAFSAKLWAENPGTTPFWHDWFVNTRPYWVYTTEGDTAQTWPGNVVVNILDPACRKAMINIVVEYQTESRNQLDGIYWDYFNTKLWSYGVDMEGDIDMDEDGIGHRNDPDEREAYRAAQVELITALRDTLGESYLQIFNGQRAYGDSTFASLADGVMYEIFPTLFFPDPPMIHALDHEYEFNLYRMRNWLRESPQGPFLLFSNPWQSIFWDQDYEPQRISTGDQFRAVALMVDGYACWSSHGGSSFSYTFGWPDVDISLGPPLGPPVYEGNFIRRSFRYGDVEIEMDSGAHPNPFDYRIRNLGHIVEELAIPFHTP